MKPTIKHLRRGNLRIHQPKYPNAASSSYFLQKALDIVTAVVSVAGFVSAMVFLATMA